MRAEIIRLASIYGRYGYRTIAGLMRSVIFKSPDTQQQITAIGAETKTMSAVEFENIILVEVKKWKKVISDSKIKPD
jgi:hypothetical protein